MKCITCGLAISRDELCRTAEGPVHGNGNCIQMLRAENERLRARITRQNQEITELLDLNGRLIDDVKQSNAYLTELCGQKTGLWKSLLQFFGSVER